MSKATIKSNRRTTIPKSARDRLRLKTGDRVEFLVREGGTALMVPATVSVRDLEGLLPPPKKPVTLGDMERAMRRRATGE